MRASGSERVKENKVVNEEFVYADLVWLETEFYLKLGFKQFITWEILE